MLPDDENEPRTNSREDIGWNEQALARYAGGASRARRLPSAPLSTRSAKAVIDSWLAGEDVER